NDLDDRKYNPSPSLSHWSARTATGLATLQAAMAAFAKGWRREECSSSRRQRWKQPASCPPNVKTARFWRGIVPFTHLAREGGWTVRMAGGGGGDGRGVAARGARAASGARAPDRDSDAVPADKCGSAGARARLSGGAAKTWMGRRGQRPVRRALDR